MSSSGIKELDAVMAALTKSMNKDMFGENYGDVEPLPTGSLALDLALGIGGFPRGRIIEIFGDESSGKTSLCLLAIAQAQKIRKEKGIEKRDLLIDLEHSLTASFIKSFGIDLDQVIWKRAHTSEEAFTLALDLPKTGMIDTVLFDSVDSAMTAAQLEKSVGDTQQIGGAAKQINFAIRQIAKLAADTDTTYLFVNQIRDGMSMYGPAYVTPGGKALPFYSSLRLRMKKSKPSPDVPGAARMRIFIIKTKVASPKFDEINIDFVYAKGPDAISDLISLAKEYKIIRLASKWVQLIDDEPDKNGKPSYTTFTEGGVEGTRQYLEENPEFREKLLCMCKQKARV